MYAQVNNGCWGNQVGTCGFTNDEVRLELDYQFGHALISQRLFKKLQSACDWPVPTPKDWQPSEACTAAVQEAVLDSDDRCFVVRLVANSAVLEDVALADLREDFLALQSAAEEGVAAAWALPGPDLAAARAATIRLKYTRRAVEEIEGVLPAA